jgi:single-strand DNA-binding protein
MLNTILLIGRLGTEPALATTVSGKPVLRFRLAVPRLTRQVAGIDAPQDDTQWFTIVAWDRLAETTATALGKGAKVFVEGRMGSRQYIARDGTERTSWEVSASHIELLTRPAVLDEQDTERVEAAPQHASPQPVAVAHQQGTAAIEPRPGRLSSRATNSSMSSRQRPGARTY